MGTTYYDTGWHKPNATTWANYGYDVPGWVYYDNLKHDDGSGAVLVDGDGINSYRHSAWLLPYSYGFQIPEEAIITGVQIGIVKQKTVDKGNAVDQEVSLRIGGFNNPNYIGQNVASNNYYSRNYQWELYGSQFDKLGANLTPAIVNDGSFGVGFRAKGVGSTFTRVGIDSIMIRIYYAIVTPEPEEVIRPPDVPNPEDIPNIVKVTDWHYPSSVTDAGHVLNPGPFNSVKSKNPNNDFSNVDHPDSLNVLGWEQADGLNIRSQNFTDWRNTEWYRQRNYGFNIPPNAVIKGIKVNMSWGVGQTAIPDAYYMLYVSSSKKSSARRVPLHAGNGSIIWNHHDSGGSADLWDLSLTPAEINNADFGVMVWGGSVAPYDRLYIGNPISITVYYEIGNVQWSTMNTLIGGCDTNDSASVVLSYPEVSNDILATGYGFNLLSNSQIVGIEAKIVKRSNNNGITRDNLVRLTGSNVNKSRSDWNNNINSNLYGDSTDLWGIENITPNMVNNNSFGLYYSAKLIDPGTNVTINGYCIAIRLYYIPNRENVVSDPGKIIFDNIPVDLSQPPTDYDLPVQPIQFMSLENQIKRQLGYIGIVEVDRGHGYETISRTNELQKENVNGAINYAKSGKVEEDRPLRIRVKSDKIKTLEGMVDLQGIVPIDTVINLSDTHPYIQRGYGILHKIEHSRVNALRSDCNIGVEYVTKDLYAPLTVDYAIRNIPPVDMNILTTKYDSICYLDNEDIVDLNSYFVSDGRGMPTVNIDVSGISITLHNISDFVSCTSIDTFTLPGKFVNKFKYTKTATGACGMKSAIINTDNNNPSYYWIDISNTGITANTPTASHTIPVGTIPNSATYTIETSVDLNNIVTTIIKIDDGTNTRTYIDTGFSISPGTYKGFMQFENRTDGKDVEIVLYTIGLAKNLFTDNIDTTLRNIVKIPETTKNNLPYDFTRKTQDGVLYCYLNPVKDIIFHINPINYFNGSVRLYDDNNVQILSNDTVLSSSDTITLENGLFKLEFDMVNNEIKLYGFLFTWIYIGSLKFDNMFNVKPVRISFDSITIQVSETRFTLKRGEFFTTMEHPNDDINIIGEFNRYWHDNGTGIGVTKEITTGEDLIGLNGLFYCTLWDTNNTIGLEIIRPKAEDIQANLIPKSNETGIGWYNLVPTENETHSDIALEYLSKSMQDITIYL